MTKHYLLEVAVASAADAETAARAGADRLELNAALEFDGLTPTRGALAGGKAISRGVENVGHNRLMSYDLHNPLGMFVILKRALRFLNAENEK